MKKSMVLLLLSLGLVSCSQNRNLPYDSPAFKKHEADKALVAAKKEAQDKEALAIKEAKSLEEEKRALDIEEGIIFIATAEELKEMTVSEANEARQLVLETIESNLLASEEIESGLQEILNNKDEINAGTFDDATYTDLIRTTIEEKLENQAEVNVSTEAVQFLGPLESPSEVSIPNEAAGFPGLDEKNEAKGVNLNIEIDGQNYTYYIANLLKK